MADDREVLNRYEYDVWGNLAVCEETVPNRFLYTGQQQDPLTRQYYLRARYYNSVIARFTQEDTYRGDGLNLYAYYRNNLVCHVDPSGHCSKDPNGDFIPPAVVPGGKQLPAVYVPQQEALLRWYANFQDDAGTAGRAGSVRSGDFMPPVVIPKQLPAVIYPLPQDLLGGNHQNRVSEPAADVPNSGNRMSGIDSVDATALNHSSVGGFTFDSRTGAVSKMRGGGHGQASIDFLNTNGLRYNIVMEYPNGVRVGNVPDHKTNIKRTGTNQSWFSKSWGDIANAGEYMGIAHPLRLGSDGIYHGSSWESFSFRDVLSQVAKPHYRPHGAPRQGLPLPTQRRGRDSHKEDTYCDVMIGQ